MRKAVAACAVAVPLAARDDASLAGVNVAEYDGFERHLAPRRGAVKNLQTGFSAVQSELAAHGITTACLAQFYSWEGGMRGPEFAEKFLQALQCFQQSSPLTLRAQLRFETHMLDHYERFADLCIRFQVPYIVFNDHIPHGALAAGKRPPRLTGQALKSGRNPDAHLALLRQMHDARGQVPAALLRLRMLLSAHTILGRVTVVCALLSADLEQGRSVSSIRTHCRNNHAGLFDHGG